LVINDPKHSLEKSMWIGHIQAHQNRIEKQTFIKIATETKSTYFEECSKEPTVKTIIYESN